MKKQFLLIAVGITALLSSCKKEEIKPGNTSNEIAPISSSSTAKLAPIDPLKLALNGWFPFDGNVNDSLGKLESTLMYVGRGVIYGSDRKGYAKSALYIDGNYFLKIKSVPQQTHTSLSVWFKPYGYSDSYKGGIVYNNNRGPWVHQAGKNMVGAVRTDVGQPGDYFDMFNGGWHHAVVTFDGSFVKVYIDSQLRGIMPFTATIASTLTDYFVGWMDTYGNWKGYVDDLRFYGRTLSDSEVNALFML